MKQRHQASSSERLELLAKEMRERALLIEGNPSLTLKDLDRIKLAEAKRKQLEKVERLKKVYFNAGRWAGGARDHNAREAFEQMNRYEA